MFLGLAIDETLLHAVAVERDGRVAERLTHSHPSDDLDASLLAMARELQLRVDRSFSGAGLAVFAPGDEAPREAARKLAKVLGCPEMGVWPVGGAAAMAEARCGRGAGERSLIRLTLGERTVAGFVLNGDLLAGAHGFAGSAGWLSLNPIERQDYRRFGGFDAEVGSAAIARRLVWRVEAGYESSVVERAGGSVSQVTARAVFEGALDGDGVAVSVVRDTVRYIAMAISNMVVTVDPAIVVLGGPTIAMGGDALVDAVRQEVLRRLPAAFAAALPVERSTLGDDAAAIGAACLAMRSPS